MHISIDPEPLSPAERHKLTIGSIVPRPIAWTTTVSDGGIVNLAPFSYFMGCHSYLPAIAVSIGSRGGAPKDTRANILATSELVVNVVTEELVERMVGTAADFPPDVSELEAAGLTPLPSLRVSPPRVAESPIHMECRTMHAISLGEWPRESTLFVARVVMWHIRADLVDEGLHIDQAALHAVGRMGGANYARARDPFVVAIPDWRTVDERTEREADTEDGAGRTSHLPGGAPANATPNESPASATTDGSPPGSDVERPI